MDNTLKREIILDNYNNPTNRGLLNKEDYKKCNRNSSTCIDNFNIELKLEDDIIKDIRFDGEACAVATASMSISINKLIGKTKKEALEIIDNYEKMINEEEFDKELLEELIVFEDIHNQPSRKKCATLGISGIKALISEDE